jgi:hypothetical protein
MTTNVAVREHLPALSYTFEQVQRMATSFAKSGLFGVKDPDSALSLMLYAQALGKHPALIMRDYELIQGRLSKKADAMLRDFQASGGRVRWVKYSDDGVTGIFSHPYCPEPITVDWDRARAERAGLAGKNGGMYDKFGRPMYRSRCITEGVRTCAPECTEQMYSPQELEGIEGSEPVATIEKAVEGAVEHVTNALPADVTDELIMSLDVRTLPELRKAFGVAWKKAEGDDIARQKLKAWYDDMKDAIERGDVEAPTKDAPI